MGMGPRFHIKAGTNIYQYYEERFFGNMIRAVLLLICDNMLAVVQHCF
jgi:hypothetical protein